MWKNPILPSTAAELTTLMIGVVNNGTGRQMQLANGIQAAAKTGTAQLNTAGQPEKSNAWIIGFAPAENPKYAIAVMLRGGAGRRDQRGHGRPPGRSDRQVGAGLHVRQQHPDAVCAVRPRMLTHAGRRACR